MEEVAVCPVSGESAEEERINFLTHLAGLALSFVGWVVLLGLAWRQDNPLLTASCWIYGASLVLCYAASTIYHVSVAVPMKRWLRIIDHSCIFLLIAGTYTPFALGPLFEISGITLLLVEWGIALAGICFKVWHIDRFRVLSVVAYLVMGWLVMFHMPELYETLSSSAMGWLVAGGAFYSLGTLFYLWESLPFNHGIWHVFVLGGSVCHYVSVLNVVSS